MKRGGILVVLGISWNIQDTKISCNEAAQTIGSKKFKLRLPEPHDFCYHSCGYDLFVLPSPGQGVCTAAGLCQCNYPCDTAPPTNQFGDQCPPYTTDPPDDDPTAIPRCLADCAALCVGGTGRVCGESYRGPITPTTDTWGKLCTCYCPPQPCVTTTTTTTKTTIPPLITTTTTRSIAIVPVPVPKIPNIFKFVKFYIMLIKFCVLYWLKVVAYYTYFCIFRSCTWKRVTKNGGWGWRRDYYLGFSE
ncbi:hypothetical protein Fcan01_10349 [Folsomia candida]|uniref:Uncharacterized protein n=1 Tax=Folsomia candida TaxID=158441 RepID=A0A226ECG3_FOLCA|nr:hypothetical protein Fcan01_10349 [Folsomia candida]